MVINKVEEFILDNKLFIKNEKILVALSGGPDSVCLLHILYKLKEKFNIELGAIHINHMLRDKEADEDEKYVSNLCDELKIKCYIKRIDIKNISEKEGISLEMAGREERYKAFEEIKNKEGYDKIAVAHNANDQAETVLMRIMRGTGLDGLTGIKPSREGGIIRPILCLNRKEIEAYCEDNNLNPRIDASNYERVYSRNKVRLDILPYMRDNFNKDIIETLNRMAVLLNKDNEFIEQQANKCYKKYCKESKNQILIEAALFKEEQEALITRIIKKAFKEISSSHKNFEMKHIYDVIELAKKETGKKINLTNGVIVENKYGDIVLKKKNEEKNKIKKDDIFICKSHIPCEVQFEQYNVYIEYFERKKEIEISNNALIKYFDYDKIEEGIRIRNRRNGDKMKPLGVKGTKKLKDIFIDLKIPREERDTVPLICIDEEISWIVNYRVSETFKITKETKNILKISFERKE